MKTEAPKMKDPACCYIDCTEPGTIHIGVKGNPDTDWICFRHLDRWNADRARCLAAGLRESGPAASAARNAAGRPVKKTAGAVIAGICGTRSTREASAQSAFTSGLRRSASRAVGGRRIRTGTSSRDC